MTALLVLTALNIVLGAILVGAIVGAVVAWSNANRVADRFHSALVQQTRGTVEAEHLAATVERLHAATVETTAPATPAPPRERRVTHRQRSAPPRRASGDDSPHKAATSRPAEDTWNGTTPAPRGDSPP